MNILDMLEIWNRFAVSIKTPTESKLIAGDFPHLKYIEHVLKSKSIIDNKGIPYDKFLCVSSDSFTRISS